MPLPEHMSPDRWLQTVFALDAAARGGVIRRQTRDIERIVGRATFARELARRGFSAVENAGQTVIFCIREPIRRWTAEPHQIPSKEFANPVDRISREAQR